MKNKKTLSLQKNAFLTLVFLSLLFVASSFVVHGQTLLRERDSEETVFCTMDAKMCPDGSFVGRVAPECEFALCPSEKKETHPPVVSPASEDGEKRMPTERESVQERNNQVNRTKEEVAQRIEENKREREIKKQEREKMIEEMREKKALFEEKQNERREEVRARLSENAQNRMLSVFENVKRNIENILLRMSEIEKRIENSIMSAKQKSEKDFTEEEHLLNQVKSSHALVRENIILLEELFTLSVSSEDPKTVFVEARKTLAIIKDLFFSMREDMQSLVSLLREKREEVI
jgi:hypothetical protein